MRTPQKQEPFQSKRGMIVAGIMSGTSADGIDVALVDLRGSARTHPKLKLLAHVAFPYPASLRKVVLTAMNSKSTTSAELAQLNWRLGLAYADAVAATLKRHPIRLDLVGCHGQTLYHQATPQLYAGKRFACTWQAGEPALIAARIGVPVVSNFRPADMAAGGQGAPLVPLLDYALFRHPSRGRILQNIGGIANMTVIPAGAAPEDCFAFDSGPGNMIIDALMLHLFNRPMDNGGSIGLKGKVLPDALQQALHHPFLRQKPPKTAGREQFGREFAADFLANCLKISKKPEDAIATATAFTAESIAHAYARFCKPYLQDSPVDFILSGGGTRNLALVQRLTYLLKPHGCRVLPTDRFGLPAEAKEAVAFALLAWQTWHLRPGNLPSATGASRPAILGQITYV
jgi:anhydro-N-acetylmuramic acid kinase